MAEAHDLSLQHATSSLSLLYITLHSLPHFFIYLRVAFRALYLLKPSLARPHTLREVIWRQELRSCPLRT